MQLLIHLGIALKIHLFSPIDVYATSVTNEKYTHQINVHHKVSA